MYKNQLAVAIKHNGKILRETKDLVKLPFGSEFSVLVKNLNSRRAKFTLHIDGQDVLDGEEIIVNANSEVEMKRFIRNGNMNEGNAFKFIERTATIEDGPRGIKVDDGVVRVEFWFEQEAPEIKTTYHRDVWWNEYPYPYYRRSFWSPPIYTDGPVYGSLKSSNSAGDLSNVKLGGSTIRSANVKGMASSAGSGPSQTFTSSASSASGTATAYNASISHPGVPCMDSTPTMDSLVSDVGITVPGSKVEQKFTTVYGFNPELQSHVIIIRLAGKIGAIEVAAPVTVKSKQKCSTCGHVNKANAKFCSECGTGLELL